MVVDQKAHRVKLSLVYQTTNCQMTNHPADKTTLGALNPHLWKINAAGKIIESDKGQIMLVILYPLSFSK
jgi:hypothetical protein